MATSAGPERVAATAPEQGPLAGLPGSEPQPAPSLRLLLDLIKRRLPALTFLCGLVLGWLVIGWWLWPVEWTNAGPWDLATPFQKRYVALVAADLSRGGDALQAKRDVAGWRPESLSALLTTMEKEAPNDEVRRQLSALQSTLALQDAGAPPLWLALLRQTTVYWSAAVAIVLLTAGVALAVVPPRWVPGLHATQHTEGEGDLLVPGLARGQGPLEPWLEAFEEAAEEASAIVDEPEEQAEEASAQPQEGEKSGARPVERVFLSTPKPENAQKEEEQAEAKGLLADLLGDEENTDRRLDVLSTMIDDVAIGDLVAQARQVLGQLMAAKPYAPHAS